MMGAVWPVVSLLVIAVLLPDVVPQENIDYDYVANNRDPELIPYISDKEYIKKINSMIDAYKGDKTGRTEIETNALINTKYRTWKRNADLINSLLALPKGMNDAGRR